ncbi:HET-domain-containing protein [Pyrenochaeta sp. DS3sAY3a]|nr:HET-domain-containing protein [Pyrenochaeta sp. DS3sAY3a]
MRLLQFSESGQLSIHTFDDGAIPAYAILSHTWGADRDELTFPDLDTIEGRNKPGYEKIRFCGEQARDDGLQHFWIDTCCINKNNKAELAFAIRSMFRWYRNAARCYVYLSDVSTRKRKACSRPTERSWEPAFRSSRWFLRGWTLQELLAPSVVEFFSQEGTKLGNKISLQTMIHEITSIPPKALSGAPLCQFSVNERLWWKEGRETKREEDLWYSLSGIFDVEIAPAYSEGAASAFKRLMDEIHKLERCVQDIRQTDPRDDKKRIEETKGGLLADSYRWVFDNTIFRQWQQSPHDRLLWIKGDPGKGKTMLLCGVIDELQSSMPKTALLSYFFCQATDSRIDNATAVLRGLLYMLVRQQPSLVSHVRKRHDHAGKALFEGPNAWTTLTEIFVDVLQDPNLSATYLIIDALDECVTDLPKLLEFVAQQSSTSDRVKWIVSSRNWPEIEAQLELAGHKVKLSLELNAESVAAAVAVFIQRKVDLLAQEKQYKRETRDAVLQHLTSNAHDTFLWVALVCQNLKATANRHVLKKIASFPPGLDALYKQMMLKMSESDDAETCRCVLATAAVLYRPVTISELIALVEQLEGVSDDAREIISLCGSFLTLREDTVYFVHQSAKDFLLATALDEIFPDGTEDTHRVIFSKSLAVLSSTLHRDMYGLKELGIPIENAEPADPDPLATSRYSCVYWVDHLYDSKPASWADSASGLQVAGVVDEFLRKKYLYWLEGLSLSKSIAKGVVSMAKLRHLVEQIWNADELQLHVQDAQRFIMYHKGVIESYPLQIYASALLFSPTKSLMRRFFQHEEPKGITIMPSMSDSWSACLQTLEGHSDWVRSVAFSHDSARLALASASRDKTVKIWDASSGVCLHTLSIGKTVLQLSFDSTGTSLYTEIGTIIVQNSQVGISDVAEPKRPLYVGIGVSSDSIWIQHGGNNMLWVPSEYRPSCSVVCGNTVGIGVGSGRVWSCSIDL